jgi:hypothetical protein
MTGVPVRKAGRREVIIGKQRNGPIGKVDLTYINRFTRFENAEKRSFPTLFDTGDSRTRR